MKELIKLASATLLLVCLFDVPYGFYQLVRFIAMIGFGVLAFLANEQKKRTETAIFVVLAILFQPLLKIALGREIWMVVDAIVAIGLITAIVKK